MRKDPGVIFNQIGVTDATETTEPIDLNFGQK